MIVYLIKHRASGRCYVGQTVATLKKRMAGHRAQANSETSRRYSLISRAIYKYGWDAFDVEVLEEAVDEADLDMAERFWIRAYNSLAPNGYNLETGGNRNKRLSEETKARMRKPRSDETRARMRRPKTQAERKALSATKRANSVLDWDKVRNLRSDRAAGMTLMQCAAKYGIGKSMVSNIARNLYWIDENASN